MSSFLTFQMCDRIASYDFSDSITNYGFSVSTCPNRRTVNTSVLHSTVNYTLENVTSADQNLHLNRNVEFVRCDMSAKIVQ